MPAPVLHFYLPPWQFDAAKRAGTIFAHVVAAVQAAGWQVRLRDQDGPAASGGYHLLLNRPVTRPNTLVLRKCIFDPFYRIEATNDRWDWQVAKSEFATDKGGEWFRNYWQGVLFQGQTIDKGGYVFAPLQGRLLQQRHFQSASPIQMIETALQADQTRPIKASLHPRENYSAQEMDALADLQHRHDGRFELAQGSMALLAGCDYVVTQNSSLAVVGMFAQKPPILFAEIDFHHLAGSVPHIGVARAYNRLNRPRKWGAYLHWYFKENAISAHDANAHDAIAARLRALGWPI